MRGRDESAATEGHGEGGPSLDQQTVVKWWVEGPVGWLEINNPPLNILTRQVRDQLLSGLSALEQERVRCAILTGAGERSFSAGADLGEELELTEETVWSFIEHLRAVYDALERFPAPVIAAINGHCMGGGLELALACDIRIAAENARFRCAGVRVGLVANAVRLVTLIGEARAKNVVLTGRDFFAAEAERFGVVSKVVPMERLRSEASFLAHMIASRAPLAVQASKRVCRAASSLPFEEALRMEEREFAQLTQTRDHKLAVTQFLQKGEGTPVFTGQ